MKIHLVHLLALCVYRNKGRGGAEEEEEKERRRPGQRGREVDGKGGRDHFVFPFRIAFMVLLQTLTSKHHPTPKPPQPPVCPVGPSLLFFSIVRGQVDSNWLFFHETDFSTHPPPPTSSQEEALFAAPQK